VSNDEEERERSESITINVQRFPADNTVVHIVGESTGDATASMQATLSDELTRSPALLVVDLSEVVSIDAAAIHALAAAIAGESDIAFCLVDGQGVRSAPLSPTRSCTSCSRCSRRSTRRWRALADRGTQRVRRAFAEQFAVLGGEPSEVQEPPAAGNRGHGDRPMRAAGQFGVHQV
jgi:anti-sigma B factor antagonist